MKNEIITFTSPKSLVSETFKTLRTNIQFMNVNNELKSILITSIEPGEGKSWLAANLAITFAQAGKKVILVDADMRRGRQHELFGISNTKGLSNLLIVSVDDLENEIVDYIQPTMVDNLYLIPAGIVPPNPSELLTSRKMLDVVKILEKMADIVIFDGTPSTMVTDAIILSRYVTTTILVSSYKKTKIEDLKQAKKNIENVGGRIGGVVMNKIPVSRRKSAKGYYYERAITVTPENKKKMPNFNLFNKKQQQKQQEEVDKVKEKLDKVVEIGQQELNGDKKEDPELNDLLNQLTSYLSNDKK